DERVAVYDGRLLGQRASLWRPGALAPARRRWWPRPLGGPRVRLREGEHLLDRRLLRPERLGVRKPPGRPRLPRGFLGEARPLGQLLGDAVQQWRVLLIGQRRLDP